jgi:hypothetical protein
MHESGAAVHSEDEWPVDRLDTGFVDRRDAEIEVAGQGFGDLGVRSDDDRAADAERTAQDRPKPGPDPGYRRRHALLRQEAGDHTAGTGWRGNSTRSCRDGHLLDSSCCQLDISRLTVPSENCNPLLKDNFVKLRGSSGIARNHF